MDRIQQIYVAMVLLLISCSPVWSASLLVTSTGNGSYALVGEGLNQVGGMELTLGYDSAALGSPVVSWGSLLSGAIKMANTGQPGLIRIALVTTTPISGSGQLAQISFSTRNGNAGFTSIMAKLINAAGATIPVSASIAADQQNTGNLTGPSDNITSSIAADSQTRGGSSPSSTSTTPTVLGGVSMPSDNHPKSEGKPAETSGNVQPPEPQKVPDDAALRQQDTIEKKPVTPEKVAELKQVSYCSVLERFKTYKGSRTPAALIALFEKPVAPELRQEPAIAVSDGSAGVRVHAKLPKGAGLSPNINLSGLELVSLHYEEESGSLILDLRPQINRIQATVTILTDQAIITYPLTVLPPAKVTTQEATFAAFLKDASAQKPRFDLNGDGSHDYLDDYIYTGHYLIKKKGDTK